MMISHERMQTDITQLLQDHAKDWYAYDSLSPHVAKVSLLMNHLYEDLGFESRTQMGRFMKENFPSLAQSKPKDTLWKKFLYDCIGQVAPACAGCSDANNCFKCLVEEQIA